MAITRREFAHGLGCLALTIPASSHAQSDWPTKQIRILVAYPPGGFPDTQARLFGARMSKILNQPVVIENRPSAATVIAGEAVAKSAPDGYTLLAGDSQMWGIAPLIYKSLPFNPMTDFTPITILSSTYNAMVVSTKFPFPDEPLKIIEFLRANPDKYFYGTAGIGSLHHLTVEVLKARTGIKIQHIPFKGSSQILPALAEGEIAVGFQSITSLPTFVKDGKIRPVAIAGKKRVKLFPDVPTFEELGIKGMDLIGTMALLGPKGLPAPIVDRIVQAIKQAAVDPELLSRLDSLNVDAVASTPSEMVAWMKNDLAAFSEAAKLADLKAE